MGAILDDLDGHEGHPLRQLPDGTTTSRWTGSTTRFTGYVPACDCGWTGTGHYEPTEAGYDAARSEWEHDHARPLLEHVIPTTCSTCCETRCAPSTTSQRNGHTPQPRRCDTSTPGVRPSHDDSTRAWSATSHRHVDRCCSGSNPAAALASVSSHEQGPSRPRGSRHRNGSSEPGWPRTSPGRRPTIVRPAPPPPVRRRWLASRNRSTRSAGSAPRSALVEPSTPCGHKRHGSLCGPHRCVGAARPPERRCRRTAGCYAGTTSSVRALDPYSAAPFLDAGGPQRRVHHGSASGESTRLALGLHDDLDPQAACSRVDRHELIGRTGVDQGVHQCVARYRERVVARLSRELSVEDHPDRSHRRHVAAPSASGRGLKLTMDVNDQGSGHSCLDGLDRTGHRFREVRGFAIELACLNPARDAERRIVGARLIEGRRALLRSGHRRLRS